MKSLILTLLRRGARIEDKPLSSPRRLVNLRLRFINDGAVEEYPKRKGKDYFKEDSGGAVDSGKRF